MVQIKNNGPLFRITFGFLEKGRHLKKKKINTVHVQVSHRDVTENLDQIIKYRLEYRSMVTYPKHDVKSKYNVFQATADFARVPSVLTDVNFPVIQMLAQDRFRFRYLFIGSHIDRVLLIMVRNLKENKANTYTRDRHF